MELEGKYIHAESLLIEFYCVLHNFCQLKKQKTPRNIKYVKSELTVTSLKIQHIELKRNLTKEAARQFMPRLL